ncbi:MAG: ribonuclease III domain-containing protein [Eubacteriales bacterium]|nr:ribonuclease III domain-containing protein [Eubacteriales bacterium]
MIAGNMIQLNSEALAYMGDAVYEQYIREKLLESGFAKVNNLHRTATKYVNASAQAKAIRTMMAIGTGRDTVPELDENEQKLVKRARNHKYNSKAKNADPVTYKWATAFEALVGDLYLSGNTDRLAKIMNRAVEIIDG